MYNPYLSQSWADRAGAGTVQPSRSPEPEAEADRQPDAGGLAQLFKGLKLDTGDVLLLLILLFLFLDDREDNLELLITLGLMLIL